MNDQINIDTIYREAAIDSGKSEAELQHMAEQVFASMLYHAKQKHGRAVWTVMQLDGASPGLSIEVDIHRRQRSKLEGVLHLLRRLKSESRLDTEVLVWLAVNDTDDLATPLPADEAQSSFVLSFGTDMKPAIPFSPPPLSAEERRVEFRRRIEGSTLGDPTQEKTNHED